MDSDTSLERGDRTPHVSRARSDAAVGERVLAFARNDSVLLACLVLIGLLFRVAFFTGYFGSDELTYVESAYGIVTGEWPTSDYVGSLRYGVNIPMAVFMKLFGVNEAAAAIWSIATSVGEIAIVFLTGRLVWGARVGFLAALVLAVLPLHVHFAGRLMADAPLALFMTSSCFAFLKGEVLQSRGWYLTAGVAAGASFWVKESTIVYLLIFAVYALLLRRWNTRWLWAAAGALVMLGLNMLLMHLVNGDALHVFHVSRAVVDKFVTTGGHDTTSPWTYPRFLLVDIRHTWLLGIFAVAGAFLLLRRWWLARAVPPVEAFVLIWALGLVGIFSLLPVSFSPLTLVFKQTNYMLMFAAPLALLAGFALGRLRGAVLGGAVALFAVGGVVLSALEQQAIQVFVANGKAAVRFAEPMPDATIYATTSNVRAEIYTNLMRGRGPRQAPFRPLADLRNAGDSARSAGKPVLAIIDTETIGWANEASPIKRVEDAPACWKRDSELQPQGLGAGRFVVRALLGMASVAPGWFATPVRNRLKTLAQPQPAFVYTIGDECRR